MFGRDKWWIREIERINRRRDAREEHLLTVIAHLAGRPLPRDADTLEPMFPEDSYEFQDSALDLEPEE